VRTDLLFLGAGVCVDGFGCLPPSLDYLRLPLVEISEGGPKRNLGTEAIEEITKDWPEQVYRPDIPGHVDQLYKKPGYNPLA